MSQGYVTYAFNQEQFESAKELGLSIKAYDQERKTALVVKKFDEFDVDSLDQFDYALELPYLDRFFESNAKQNMWQIFLIAPFNINCIVSPNVLLCSSGVLPLWNSMDVRRHALTIPTSTVDFRGDHIDHPLKEVFENEQLDEVRSDVLFFQYDTTLTRMIQDISFTWQESSSKLFNNYVSNDFEFDLLVSAMSTVNIGPICIDNSFSYVSLDNINEKNIQINRDIDVKVNNYQIDKFLLKS